MGAKEMVLEEHVETERKKKFGGVLKDTSI